MVVDIIRVNFFLFCLLGGYEVYVWGSGWCSWWNSVFVIVVVGFFFLVVLILK